MICVVFFIISLFLAVYCSTTKARDYINNSRNDQGELRYEVSLVEKSKKHTGNIHYFVILHLSLYLAVVEMHYKAVYFASVSFRLFF
jgi:hypothetical protein